MFTHTRKPIPAISLQLQTVLQQIADDAVNRLGCVGALVATLEHGNALPVRAFAIEMPMERLAHFEEGVGISLVGPDAVVYLNDRKHRHNLSVRAVNGVNGSPQPYLISASLHDLLQPLVDKPVANLIQQELGIQQVAAIPFTLDGEVVGNLFASSQSPFSPKELESLVTLSRQAAAAIQSERDLNATRALEGIIFKLQSKMTDETEVLQAIVDAMVNDLEYAGAIVATLEAGGALPVRTYAVDVAADVLRQLEDKVGVSLSGPQAVVYLDNEKHQDNISVRAVKELQKPKSYLMTDSLYDLLRPIAMKPLADLAQRLVGFKQIIAIPFFLENEVVGNLFVATRRPSFTEREIRTLTAFGQQAAAGLRNARLYRIAEERREIAQKFGRMAFSATASVHDLRNHVGVVRNYLHLLTMIHKLPQDQHADILADVPTMMERLTAVTEILDNLHQPWHQIPDRPVHVNHCIIRAIGEVFPGTIIEDQYSDIKTKDGITLTLYFAPDLPVIKTALDMLTEAFRIVIKNAAEALKENGKICKIWIATQRKTADTIEIIIRDSGAGIQPENIARIFDMGWSTKSGQGMGFGLFWAKDYLTGFGGDIQVESKWGDGATFRITLPTYRNHDRRS
ncbi:MAG: GAF domain-containing protein [Ardenticatenaceae bacterium]|nr:GAF domain-containing protein [Ardenticatenaceae bacterium]